MRTIQEILSVVVRFLVSIYRDQSGLLRAFVNRNHTDPDFRARQERLTLYVNRGVSELLLEREDEILHANPERSVRFMLTLIFGSLEYLMLFGDLRSGAVSFSDDAYSAELTQACLAYLGLTNTEP